MRERVFTGEHAWGGEDIQLAIEVANDERAVCEMLTAIWSVNGIIGPYLHQDRDPHEQAKVTACDGVAFDGPLYGVTRINGVDVPCSTLVDFDEVQRVFFAIPDGSLGAYVGLEWPGVEAVVIPWLVDFAECIYAKQRFSLALITTMFDTLPTAASIRDGVPAWRQLTHLVGHGERLIKFEQSANQDMDLDL